MTKLSRVLIVDDTETDRYIVSRLIRKSLAPDVEILEAGDGQEAIDILNALGERLPDLILLDINMPRMNGHQFLQAWFDEGGRETPVVMMLTSSSNAEDRRLVDRFAGVRNYLVKPIDRGQVAMLPSLID